jgi:hypothetical protein
MAMAAATQLSYLSAAVSARVNILSNTLDLWRAGPEFAGISRGREVTRKTRRLACGMPQVDQLIGGGIARGRISELTGGAGKAALAADFAASATRDGEVAAWMDLDGCCDPASMAAAGIDLERMLWTAPMISESSSLEASAITEEGPNERGASWESATTVRARADISYRGGKSRPRPERAMLKAAEWLMAAGGFGLIVVDFGRLRWPFRSSVAMRLARGAEQSGTALIILSARRLCGTFAALSLTFDHGRASFSRACPGAPMLFDGFVTDLHVARNKLGGSQGAIVWKLTTDPNVLYDDAAGAGLAAPIEPPRIIAANDRAVSC